MKSPVKHIMKKGVILTLALLILLPTFLLSCTDDADGTEMTVAVTIEPIAALVRGVCGERVHVVTAVPAGASPESYDPTPRQVADITEADIYFSIGLPAEGNILPVLSEGTELISLDAACREVYPELLMHGERDPHIWLSPSRARVMIQVICDALCEFDADGAELYRRGAEMYLEKLDAADTAARETLADCTGKAFVVYHPSFAYFADEYGIEMYALEEHGKEAYAKQLEEMILFSRERGISTVFCQPENPRKQVDVLARELDGTAVVLDALSGDYTDNIVIMATEIAKAAR